ncbi:MAG: AhpC/TSA family protein [Alistipes sp.]|nr:AhpC/TSA family protein [Alistipes sp.]
MKKLFIILAIAAVAVGCDRARCVIEGDVLGVPDGVVKMVTPDRKAEVLDSVEIKGGRFKFAIDDEEVQLVAIMSEESRMTLLFTESGKIKVNGNFESDTIMASGTESNDALTEYMTEMKLFSQRYAQSVEEQRPALREEQRTFYEGMVEKNMGNIFGVTLYIQGMLPMLPEKEALATLNGLPEHLRNLAIVQEAVEACERKMRVTPQEGEPLPHYIDTVQPDVKGNDISLKSVIENPKNRYVLLDFWASWCGPCMGEMPYLRDAYKKYHKLGFEIYGVSLDSKADAWRKAIEEQSMKWINVSRIEGFQTQAAYDYAVNSIPSNFLIDCKTGEIIATSLRETEVEAKLKELLKK